MVKVPCSYSRITGDVDYIRVAHTIVRKAKL